MRGGGTDLVSPLCSAVQVPAAIMTDGERREPFQPPASEEVRVPIASLPSQAPRPGEDEDALSACKSIQGSLGSGGSPTRDPARELGSEEEEQVPYPALAPTVFFCLKQTTRPRSWCLKL
ncbi:voltage-dependent T-type calcium channel subunit alpha-1H-like [Alligator mississippiensis]|nr:voltage-dependent T-type calcium channel subunit alpha-1H-like [Alligator mississippiensis]